MIREVVTYPLRANQPIKTLLIGGFLLATGTVLSMVFVLGYLVRVLAPATTESVPGFDQWRTLAFDGIRALVIWIAYLVVPLLVLVFWIELFVTGATTAPFSPLDQHLLNVLVHGIGVTVGGPIAFRALVQTVYDLAAGGGVFATVLPLVSSLSIDAIVGYLGVLYAMTLLVSVYLLPIAFTNFAVTRTLRSAFEVSTLKKAALSRTYAIGWCCAVLFLLIGAAGPILWNEWRLVVGGVDWGLLHIGYIPVVAHPTPTGVQSVVFLVLASFANFYLLVAAYALLSSVLIPLIAPDASQSNAHSTDTGESR